MKPRSKLVALLYEAFDELDRSLSGLTAAEAVAGGEGSSFAWTLAHTTNQVDTWINARFQKLDPHPLIGQREFRVGGSGQTTEWAAIQTAVKEARETARSFLVALTDEELEPNIPYDGSFGRLRATGINLRYALMRAIAHHYFHIGEISTKRRALGHEPGDYPGLLQACL